ncbi:MAG: hypothetical protein A2078_00505 [Nitrospirae bacterium GWC2_57_9]|nr:MAG: hypothetical protein A2078_00505 [Nitrospirae bacterium GWC2_57_9]
MARIRSFADVLRELHEAKKSGQLFVLVLESSEDLIRIYLKNGEIYYVSYGSATGQDALDIVEYYTFDNATFVEGSTPPAGVVASNFQTEKFISLMAKADKKVRVP